MTALVIIGKSIGKSMKHETVPGLAAEGGTVRTAWWVSELLSVSQTCLSSHLAKSPESMLNTQPDYVQISRYKLTGFAIFFIIYSMLWRSVI